MEHHPAIAAGKVAVVTGAAGGIGLAAARRLAEAGMTVVLADIDEAALQAAAGGIGPQAFAVVTDVSKREDVERLKAAARAHGDIALLMNNAALGGAGSGLLAGEDIWRRTLEVKSLGPDPRSATVRARHDRRRLALRHHQHRVQAGHHPAPGDTAYTSARPP